MAAAWLLLRQDHAHERSAADPGVPELPLLTDRPPGSAPTVITPPTTVAARSSSVSTPQVQPAPASHAADATCISLGPFATQQALRNARGAIGNQVSHIRARHEQTTQSHGWWVYLPGSANHEQALALARQLSARHIADFFVVGAGDQSNMVSPNTVSLGLFKDPANARKRRDEIAAAGFAAQLTERTERVPTYWLDLVAANGAGFDWRRHIHEANVGSRSTDCF